MHGDMENTRFFRKYINDIARYPVLSREEEKLFLLKVRQGNEKSRKRITCANLRFVMLS
jgi:RNA polymerase primary sigma factor